MLKQIAQLGQAVFTPEVQKGLGAVNDPSLGFQYFKELNLIQETVPFAEGQ